MSYAAVRPALYGNGHKARQTLTAPLPAAWHSGRWMLALAHAMLADLRGATGDIDGGTDLYPSKIPTCAPEGLGVLGARAAPAIIQHLAIDAVVGSDISHVSGQAAVDPIGESSSTPSGCLRRTLCAMWRQDRHPPEEPEYPQLRGGLLNSPTRLPRPVENRRSCGSGALGMS